MLAAPTLQTRELLRSMLQVQPNSPLADHVFPTALATVQYDAYSAQC